MLPPSLHVGNISDMQITPISKAFFDRLADAAAAAILPHFRTELAVENKLEGAFDPVTVADKAGEVAMRELIETTYPDHGILGEEFGNVGLDRERVWVLDPVDGTRSFIAGIPLWGTLIGLRAGCKAVQGMSGPALHRRALLWRWRHGHLYRAGRRAAAQGAALRRHLPGNVVHHLAPAVFRQRAGGLPFGRGTGQARPLQAPIAMPIAWSRPGRPISSSRRGCSPTTSRR